MKTVYLLAALVFTISSLSGQTDWNKYPGNPVMEPGDEGEWANSYACCQYISP